MKRVISIICALLFLSIGAASASDIGFNTAIPQGTFRSIIKEGGMGLAYRYGAPAAPLGWSGFDAGIEVSVIDIGSENWAGAFKGDSAPDYIAIPKLRARKGLPYGFDIGGIYGNVVDTNVQLYGFELSKAILEGGAASPALGVRGSYTRLSGVNDLDIQTIGLDAAVSKGFLILTPYAGAGMVWITGKATGDLQRLATLAGSPLADEKIWQPRVFVGLEVKPFPLFRIVGEFEYAVRPIYTIKAAIGF